MSKQMTKMSGAQSKKRGPNSPNESEKTKVKPQQPSAAVTALTMATVLSTMTGGLIGGGASQRNDRSDSDEDDELKSQHSQHGSQHGSQQSQHASRDTNVWSEENLVNSQVRSPKKVNDPLRPLFSCVQDGPMRDEIVVEILSKNKKKFTGTITPLEAKHQIYIKGLKFDNHDNFDGVRINYKGKLVVTFKLIEPINIDDLASVEHFDFTRVSSANGKRIEDVIGCKVKGIRYRSDYVSSFDNLRDDDGLKVVKIEGCEYRIPEENILAWLSLYGETTSKLEEDRFRDESEATGNNRTGNYSIMMRLNQNIPQLLPMCGRRIKIYHAGIQKLCTNCFGEHKKQHCQVKDKTPWLDYVHDFMESNESIPKEYYGRWNDIVQNEKEEKLRRSFKHPGDYSSRTANGPEQTREPSVAPNTTRQNEDSIQTPEEEEQTGSVMVDTDETTPPKAPTKEDFDIPTTSEAYEMMVDKLASVGLAKWEVDKAIEAKTTAFNRACREFKKTVKAQDPKTTRRAGRNSTGK